MGERRWSLALAATSLVFSVQAGADLPRPDKVYEEGDAVGRSVDLAWYDAPFGPLAVLTLARPLRDDHAAPTLQDFSEVLDRLLTRLAKDHPGLMEFKFAPGSLSPALVAELDRRLAAGAGGWDAGRGRPRTGAPGDVLKAELRKVVAESPVEAAFAAHGYALVLESLARIEMGSLSGPGRPKVPTAISEINMVAVREATRGDAARVSRPDRDFFNIADGVSLWLCEGTAMLPAS